MASPDREAPKEVAPRKEEEAEALAPYHSGILRLSDTLFRHYRYLFLLLRQVL